MGGKLASVLVNLAWNVGGVQQHGTSLPENCRLFVDTNGQAEGGGATDPGEAATGADVQYAFEVDGRNVLDFAGDQGEPIVGDMISLDQRGVDFMAQRKGCTVAVHCEGLSGKDLVVRVWQRGVEGEARIALSGGVDEGPVTGTLPGNVQSAVVVPSATTVKAGESFTLEAVALDAQGRKVFNAPATDFLVLPQIGGPVKGQHYGQFRQGNEILVTLHADCPPGVFKSYCVFGATTDPAHVTSPNVVVTVVA